MEKKTEKVLAKVNGKEINEGHIKYYLKLMGSEGDKYNNPEGIEKIVDELIGQELILKEAKEKKYEDEAEFKEELEIATETLLRQYAVKKLFDKVKVTEEDLTKYYEENKEKFKTPLKVRVKHILVDDKKKANNIREEILNGEKDFESAAKEYSTCPSAENGGDLGEVGPGQMVSEFEKAMFSAAVGKVSQPVKTQYGYHLLKVDERKEPVYRDLDSIRFALQRQLVAIRQQNAYIDKVQELLKDADVEYLIERTEK